MIPDDETNERLEAEISDMMDTDTLIVNTSEELFTVETKTDGNTTSVYLKTSGTFDYVITESDLALTIPNCSCTIQKKDNTHFTIIRKSATSEEDLLLQFILSSDKVIYLEKENRYINPAVPVLIKRLKINT